MQSVNQELPINVSRFLPHRKPMLMVELVVGLTDSSIETSFDIKEDNIFLENGFFNETGVIENAEQTCSGIVGWSHFEKNSHDENYRVEGFISKIDKVEIYKLPPTNTSIQTKGELLSMHQIGDVYNCKMNCRTFLGDEEIAHSLFTLIIKP